MLGRGGFGEVHKGRWKGTEVAVKTISAEHITREMKKSFSDETSIMSRLRHPNVVLFMAASTKPPLLCIVMEYMALGSLYDVRRLIPPISLPFFFSLFLFLAIFLSLFCLVLWLTRSCTSTAAPQ
jgi:serine/threonine protein kinase